MDSHAPRWRTDAPADAARVVELDGLRGLAAAAIVFFHCGTQRLPLGWTAVDLFFVLSGYLITSIILKHGHEPGFLKTFYVRRGLRIWPIYYLTVAAVACAWPFVPQRVRWAGLPYTLTYTQYLSRHCFVELPDYSPYLWHTWSLAIEEQFYVIWPALLLVVGRRRVVPMSLACVALAVLGRTGGWSWSVLGARCDALALGGLLAVMLIGARASERWARSAAAVFSVVLIAGLAGLAALGATVGLNLPAGSPPWPALTLLAVNSIWFGVVGLIVRNAGRPVLWPLRTRVPVYLGQISYGLYLYHFVAIRVGFDIAMGFGYPPTVPWVKAPAVVVSLIVAALSWRYIERPLLKRKERYRYGAVRPGAAPHVLARELQNSPRSQGSP